jgi:hypothetical protein
VRETWSLTLWEEHSLRVFENRVQRIIFGQKVDEVTGNWRQMHNEELHNLFFAKYNWNILDKEDKMDMPFSTHGSEEECIQSFGENARRNH